tara:strand:- start:124 stop:270 length:147 start_codon:yes stop_codon:yes gene_type:complete
MALVIDGLNIIWLRLANKYVENQDRKRINNKKNDKDFAKEYDFIVSSL